MMARVVSILLLFSIVLALPFSRLAAVSASTGQAIMALDVCGPDSTYGVQTAPALTEPMNLFLTFRPSFFTPEAEPDAGVYIFAVSIDKPPVA